MNDDTVHSLFFTLEVQNAVSLHVSQLIKFENSVNLNAIACITRSCLLSCYGDLLQREDSNSHCF